MMEAKHFLKDFPSFTLLRPNIFIFGQISGREKSGILIKTFANLIGASDRRALRSSPTTSPSGGNRQHRDATGTIGLSLLAEAAIRLGAVMSALSPIEVELQLVREIS
jgi:hypothetical protein